jgi:hypothetical protein
MDKPVYSSWSSNRYHPEIWRPKIGPGKKRDKSAKYTMYIPDQYSVEEAILDSQTGFLSLPIGE